MRHSGGFGRERERMNFGKDMGRARREMAEKRKNEFLHTRVSDSLKAKVKKRADELGVPSSIFIRNVLESYFDSSVTSGSVNAKVLDVKIPEDIKNISGWQEFLPLKQQPCRSCERDIIRGDKAFRGIAENSETLGVYCRVCVSEFLSK